MEGNDAMDGSQKCFFKSLLPLTYGNPFTSSVLAGVQQQKRGLLFIYSRKNRYLNVFKSIPLMEASSS